MGNIAVITARSGSKGLTDKNIRQLCGKPLLAYSVECALQSGCFEKVLSLRIRRNMQRLQSVLGRTHPFSDRQRLREIRQAHGTPSGKWFTDLSRRESTLNASCFCSRLHR